MAGMKLLPLLTLLISAGIALYGVSDLTRPNGVTLALFGLLGVAISGGALAICSAINALLEKKEAELSKLDSEWQAEKTRRALAAFDK
jgi:hypothetical protein